MTVVTFKPVSGANSPVDGEAGRITGGAGESFASLQAGAGTFSDVSSSLMEATLYSSVGNTPGNFNEMVRSIMCFNTASIPVGANIQSVTLSLYIANIFTGLGSTDIHVAGATPASTSNIASSDFSNTGSTSFGSLPMASLTSGAYNVWTLNASGIAAIIAGGITKLSVKTAWDILNAFTGVWAQSFSGVNIDTADSGTSFAPVLTVTYVDPNAPQLTTAAVTNIGKQNATAGGNVTSDGGFTVTDRGVVWSTSPNPTTANNKVSTTGTTGAFTVPLTNLPGGTLIYVRAYATNSKDTNYGAQVTFITVAYDPVEKTYIHKVFSPTGVYIGILQNVFSEFTYNMTSGSIATQLSVKVQLSADNIDQSADYLLDENSNYILDENNNYITDERQPDVIGQASGAIIAENNQIVVYELSTNYPNGKVVFNGYMSKWKTIFGGDDNIEITCISQGQDLNNYLVSTGDSSVVTQATDTGTTYPVGSTQIKSFDSLIQTFTVPSNMLIGAISGEFNVPESGNISVFIYQMVGATPSPATDPFITSGATHVFNPSTGKIVVKVSMSNNPQILAANIYYAQYQYSTDSGNYNEASIYTSNANPYPTGKAYTYSFNIGSGTLLLTPLANTAAYFIVWQHGGNITSTYVQKDLSFILTDLMTAYISQGGKVSMPAGGYANTGVVISYQFKMSTIYQAIQTIIGFAPANWFYYVDPATNILYFQQLSSSADITVVKTRHIDELEIEATAEGIKNNVYLTGGDDGTGTNTNILVQYTVPLGTNRQGLALITDNRINSTNGGKATALLEAQSYQAQNASTAYNTTITIIDGTMDITLLQLGKLIGFAGFGSFPERLLLETMNVERHPDYVVLQLGALPIRASSFIQQLNASLTQLQTVDNPITAG